MSFWQFLWRTGWFVRRPFCLRWVNFKSALVGQYYSGGDTGHRCREQTALPDTSVNRKRVNELLQKVEAMILLGDFNYAEYFPDSRNLKKVQTNQADAGGGSTSENGKASV